MAGAGLVDTLVAANWVAALCTLKRCSLVGYDNSHALKVVYEQSGHHVKQLLRIHRTWDNFSWTLSMTDLFPALYSRVKLNDGLIVV